MLMTNKYYLIPKMINMKKLLLSFVQMFVLSMEYVILLTELANAITYGIQLLIAVLRKLQNAKTTVMEKESVKIMAVANVMEDMRVFHVPHVKIKKMLVVIGKM